MKSASKTFPPRKLLGAGNPKVLGFLMMGCLVTAQLIHAATDQSLFTVVPANDPVYGQLHQLSEAQLLSPSEVNPPLTRFDVAQDILQARDRYDAIVVADASTASSAPAANASAAKGSVANATLVKAPSVVYKAGVVLHNLEETYRYELSQLRESVRKLAASLDDLDAQEYAIRKRVKGIEQYPTIAIHGLGRAFGLTQQYTGDYSGLYFPQPGFRMTTGYLDLEPEAVVTKEIKFSSVIRAETNFSSQPINAEQSGNNFILTFRRMTLEFNPPWLSSTFGDFEESYTPLTLWNRNNLDLMYMPEMWARQDEIMKYESYLNHEPDWPFRGMRLGTNVLWPDSDLLSQLKVSAFVNMIRNGFDDSGAFGGWYFGPNQFTDWLVGGNLSLKSPKWYAGDSSWQAQVDSYGLILDEPLYTNQPGTAYNPNDPSTWAHQYLLGSVKPSLRVGMGDNVYAGAEAELAYSSYQDDKQDSQRVTGDWAVNGGTYLQVDDSKISFNYLDVGPYYYAPLAQTRQDAVTDVKSMGTNNNSPELWQSPVRSEYFLSDVPRPGQIYSFYDRTQDNTFPYGLATPNREAVGMELDIRALDKKALRVRGAAYLAQEIQSDLVLNNGQYLAVDAPYAVYPIRQFTYVNVGPSYNLGPDIGFGGDLEIGANARFEQTTSSIGTLTSAWGVGGIRADFLPVWEVTAAYSQQNAHGTDTGYMLNGAPTLWARYVYIFDNSDYGQYQPFSVNGTNQSLRLSNAFKINRNSTLYLDYDWTFGNLVPSGQLQGTLNNQFGEVTYEVQF